MFFLSSVFSGLKFWSVNYTSTHENSELKVFKTTKCLSEISNKWPNNLFGTNAYSTLDLCW